MLHHKISKEFHFGSFTESTRDTLDIFFLIVSERLQNEFQKKKKKKMSDPKNFLKVSDAQNKAKIFS